MGAKNVTPEERRVMQRMSAEGYTFTEIGKRLGRSGSTVGRVVNGDNRSVKTKAVEPVGDFKVTVSGPGIRVEADVTSGDALAFIGMITK
jgi:hypothetical protein